MLFDLLNHFFVCNLLNVLITHFEQVLLVKNHGELVPIAHIALGHAIVLAVQLPGGGPFHVEKAVSVHILVKDQLRLVDLPCHNEFVDHVGLLAPDAAAVADGVRDLALVDELGLLRVDEMLLIVQRIDQLVAVVLDSVELELAEASDQLS